jgi:hypothetical protein
LFLVPVPVRIPPLLFPFDLNVGAFVFHVRRLHR